MKDRTPTYPGRVRLIPVAGQQDVYDLQMADEPTEEGTPPTKAYLLQDATAALINTLTGTTPSTVNAALSAITSKTKTLWNGRVQIATGSYTGTGTYGSANKNSLTFSFTPKLVCISPCTTTDQITTNTGASSIFMFVWGQPYAYPEYTSNRRPNILTYNVNTVQWYNTNDATAQFNSTGGVIQNYYYVAIG